MPLSASVRRPKPCSRVVDVDAGVRLADRRPRRAKARHSVERRDREAVSSRRSEPAPGRRQTRPRTGWTRTAREDRERRRHVVERVVIALLAAPKDALAVAAELRGGVVPEIETQHRQAEVAAHVAARADQPPIGRVVVAGDQSAEAPILDADEAVARDDAGVGALVGQAALLEAGERAFELPERAGVRASPGPSRRTRCASRRRRRESASHRAWRRLAPTRARAGR